jgi:hypothetical protein
MNPTVKSRDVCRLASRRRWWWPTVTVALVAGAFVGWVRGADAGLPGGPPAGVEKTSFEEVTRHLDPGGSIYVYLATEQWLKGLSGKVAEWHKAVRSLPGLSPEDQANIDHGFALAVRLVRNSGLESVSGVGLSGIAIGEGFYRTRSILHRYPGGEGGYLWSLAGSAPHTLRGLELLPADTVMAGFFDLDLAGLWRAIEADLQESGMSQGVTAMRDLDSNVSQATGSTLVQLLGSLGVEHGLVVTLDETRKVTIPMPNGSTVEIPEPALALAFRTKDHRLFDWLEAVFSENPEVIRAEREGALLRTLPVPLPLPLEFRPTLVRKGEYLILASSDRVAGGILDVQDGKRAGLKAGDAFVRLARGMPTEGNQFTFVSGRVTAALRQFQEAMLTSAPREEAAPVRLLQSLLNAGPPPESYAVAANTGSGWLTVAQGNQEPANAVLLPMVVFPAAIIAGVTLPALAKAKDTARSIRCVNNLKQIGLGARIYAVDHDDTFPPDLLSIKNELVTPRVLICPEDPTAVDVEGLTWETFDPSKSSYEFLTPGEKDHGRDPERVMVRCRFHGHVCRMDGSVVQRPSR